MDAAFDRIGMAPPARIQAELTRRSDRHVHAIAVDWSGASRHEQRHLWLAEAGADGRLVRLTPMTRAGAVDAIVAAAERDPELVVGLDFAFSMPAWWLRRARIADAAELWSDSDRLERWLARSPYPFWGRPGHRRPRDLSPVRQWRRTELGLRPRPKSVFQTGGAGSVGTGSLRGMPALARLREAGLSVWPFEKPRLPVVVEMWPRLFTGPVVKSNVGQRAAWIAALSKPGQGRLRLADVDRQKAEGSEDAFDAMASALGLRAALRGTAWRHVAGGLVPGPARVVELEGWIFGAPIPAPSAVAAG